VASQKERREGEGKLAGRGVHGQVDQRLMGIVIERIVEGGIRYNHVYGKLALVWYAICKTCASSRVQVR